MNLKNIFSNNFSNNLNLLTWSFECLIRLVNKEVYITVHNYKLKSIYYTFWSDKLEENLKLEQATRVHKFFFCLNVVLFIFWFSIYFFMYFIILYCKIIIYLLYLQIILYCYYNIIFIFTVLNFISSLLCAFVIVLFVYLFKNVYICLFIIYLFKFEFNISFYSFPFPSFP